jgi:hypothetical protein
MWEWITPRSANVCLLTDPLIFWLRNVSEMV